MSRILFSAIWGSLIILGVSIILIRKNFCVRPLKVFIILYIVGQIIGYGLGVDLLKVVVPSIIHPETGIMFQIIPSVVFPLALAFIFDYVYGLIKKQ